MDRRRFLAATAAALAAGPSALAARTGGTALALVTADLESSVVAVELATGRIHRRLATPHDPRSIESIGGTAALVAHTAAGRLTLIDERLRVHPIDGALAAPRYAAVSRGRRFAYVSDSERRELAVVDLHERRIVARVAVGGAVRHLALGDRRLWAVLGNVSPRVAVVDLALPHAPRVVGTVRPPFGAHDVGFTPGGRRVWLTSGDRGRLAIHDARTGNLVRTVGGDAPPQHVTFLGDRAYVTSGDDGLLRVHALDGRLLRTQRVPTGSYNVQEGFGLILTPSLSQGTLCTFGANGAPRERLRVARSSHDACFLMAA